MTRPLLLWLLICAGAPLALAGDGTRPDPLPLRRVLLKPEQVAAELERAQKGVLALLPRAEFEAKVQQAALATELAGNPPRLVKTVYSAEVVDQALVGSAEWSVLHTGTGPGLLALTDFNLALGRQFTVDGGMPLCGDLDGKTPSLWIEKPGTPTVAFAWSRHGVAANDGLHFDLEMPACANAQLHLLMPADRVLGAVKPGLMITGPQETGDPGLHKWTVNFAGRSRLELVVRRLDDGGGGPVLLATLQTRQELGPDRLLSDYDFQIEAPHSSVRQLVFGVDSPLVPYEVTLAGADVKACQWTAASAASPGQGQLTVWLKEPLQGVLPVLRMRCLAPVTINTRVPVWTSPGVRLRGAVARGETLRLHVLPEAHLESWKPGHFRLLKSLTEPNGTLVLTLSHGGVALPRPAALGDAAGAAVVSRPSAVVRARPCEFLTRQRTWWQIEKQQSTQTTEIDIQPRSGQLFHVPLKLPPDCQLEQISVEPKAQLRGWVARGTPQNPLLLIDLAQPATLQSPVKIKLRLRLPLTRTAVSGAMVVPFVETEPFDPCLREGSLAISIHPQWRAELLGNPPGSAAVPAEGPWQLAPVDYYFTFRGKGPAAALRLVPRAPQLQAHCQTDVLLGGSRGTLVTRLTLEPSGGGVDHVDVMVSTALAEPWKIVSEGPGPRIAGIHRTTGLDATAGLLLLGSHHALDALTMLAAQPGSQIWRIRFAEPVSSRLHLVLSSSFAPTLPAAAGTGQQAWSLPIVSVGGAEEFGGDIAVQLLGAEVLHAEAERLQEVSRPAGAAGKGSATPRGIQQLWRVYRYNGPWAPGEPPRLVVQTRAVAAVAARETCESAALTTYVEPDGRLIHHFKFQLRGWRQREVPLLLPPGAQILLVGTEGRRIDTYLHEERKDGLYVELPASAALAVQRFELVYATAQPAMSWSPWRQLPASLPKLPVKPLELRHTWLLPPGLAPLDGSMVQLMHRPDQPRSPATAAQMLEQVWDIGGPQLASLLTESSTPPWAVVQRQHVAAMSAALRQLKAPKAWTLGQTLEWMTVEHWKHQVPVIVDAAALAAAGLGVETSLGATGQPVSEAWARLGLILVPTPSGVLLTTGQQWLLWGGQDAGSLVLPGPFADGLAQASLRGQDSSGRFWSTAAWLSRSPGLALTATVPDLALAPGRFTPDGVDSSWTQWEAPAGTEAVENLVVVQNGSTHVLGLLLALLWLLATYAVRRRWTGLWRARLLLAWLALTALAAIWLPAPLRPAALWPAAAALLLGLVWYARTLRAAPPSAPASLSVSSLRPSAAIAGAVVTLIVLCTLPPLWSQVTDPNIVLMLPTPADAPDRESVLVSPDLLKKLDGLIRRSPIGMRGAVLTAASYQGWLTGELAIFEAHYQLHSFDDKATLTIPLGGVELREGALLDDGPVQPVAGALGYAVAVKGQGAHQLKLKFSVRLQAVGDHRDLRFTVPRLFQNRLMLRTPGKRAAWQVLSGIGYGDQNRRRLHVELGRDAAVHLRYTPTGPVTPAKVSVREAYFWDLRTPGSECTAILDWQIAEGSLTHFAIALPDTLEPRAVEVSGDGEGDEASRPRLKEWHVSADKGQWRLHVTLQAPTTGQVQLTLRLLPRQPLHAEELRLQLPLPMVAKESLAGGIMGYRIDHPNPIDKGADFRGLFLTPEKFAKQWPGAGAVLPTRAYSFDTHTLASALVVNLPPAKPSVEQDLHWTIYPDHAEIEATLKAKAAGDDLVVIDWDVPIGVTVAEITGDNVQTWTRGTSPADPRVQVWLKQPARTATLQMRGWTGYAKAPAGQPLRWMVPTLRSADGVNAGTMLRITASPAVHIEGDLKKFKDLVLLPQMSSWTCSLPQGRYRAEFLLRPAAPPPRVLELSSVEVRDGAVQWTAALEVHLDHGGAASFHIGVAGWQGLPLKLDGLGVVRVRRPAGGAQEWRVQVSAAMPRRLVLKLSGSQPAAAGLHFALPHVQLHGAQWTGRWVGVSTPGLQVQAAAGLTALKEIKDLPPFIAEHVARPAVLWKVAQGDWRLALGVAQPSAAPGVQVLHTEQHAAFGDTFGWIHQSLQMLYVKDSYDLTVALPPGALLLTATVDGEPLTPRFVDADRVALTLPAGEGVRLLSLRWVFGGQNELLTQPRLQAPRLEGLPASPIFWTVALPVGYRLEEGAPGTSPALAALRQHLDSAEALAQASELLAQRPAKTPTDATRDPLAIAQKQFFRQCRLALLLLESPAGDLSATTRADHKQRLANLLDHNAAALHKAGLDKLRVRLEKSASLLDREIEPTLPVRGTIMRWHTDGAAAPALKLVAVDVQRTETAWRDTQVVACIFLLLLGLTWVPGVKRFWPEQLAVVAAAGWYLGGFAPLALLLLAAAALGRGWRLRS